jgi:hypothetical protein
MRELKQPCRCLIKHFLLLLITFGLITLPTAQVQADDENAENTESYYSNPAQAAHASQLADKAAHDNDEVEQAFNDFKEARHALGDEPTD